MASEQEVLSHEEVWDDSALIDSWNEALAEYKLQSQTQESTPTKPKRSDPDIEDAQPEQIQSTSTEPAASIGSMAPPPQALLGSIGDEGLKKLLMSWYYAGYYTGLYEGQQQQSQKPS
ncbi:uncharacterized protein CPUR_00712 [Claviceps purpurea 20.1]|uniref:Survival Motor Neuron Gemin2-binding domain-containing protein n=1 Tax=Claviceps purpurea (strain 20.1) TaxID=1111077 RepID=M1W211_CLAP2|nr:uncharacterized protein CPUR_00712 [Claviceps purpurea 20.1]